MKTKTLKKSAWFKKFLLNFFIWKFFVIVFLLGFIFSFPRRSLPGHFRPDEAHKQRSTTQLYDDQGMQLFSCILYPTPSYCYY
jgi:hypothetical protein